MQNVDNGRSPNVEVIIKNVTFDGGNLPFRRPWRLQSDGKDRISGTGAGILVDGDLKMENVTFTRGNGIWVRAKGTASLRSVIFKDSWITNFGFRATTKGVLHVAKSASVTLENGVFRDVARVPVAIEKGGRLTTKGCLSFIRVWTHRVNYSGVFSGLGAWSNSAGPCSDSMNIGNGDQARVAYSPPTLDCGLPSSGTIEGAVVYTLSQNCVCVSTVNIAEGANVTINANDNRIEGCSTGEGYGQFRVGNARLTINNANLYNMRVRNYGGTLVLRNSMVADTHPVPIVNYGWAHLYDSLFAGNRGTGNGRGKAYYGHGWFHLGRAIFGDNVFRNNIPLADEIEAYTTGSSTAIYLCGENILDGAVPMAVAEFFMAVNGGRILGCSDNQPSPERRSEVCQPEKIEPPWKKLLGAIGVIFHKQKCPHVIEIWEVMPNSQGKFALEVNQNEIEAVAEGLVACSSDGRAAVRIGLTEPVRQQILHSRAYQAASPRLARDILISLGPNAEGKVLHLVIDNALDGSVLGTVNTLADEPPCQGVSLSSVLAGFAAPPQPTPIPYAAPVAPQEPQSDGSIVHVVRPGDTIWQIGIAYNVHPHAIITLNQLYQLRNRGHYIYPGQKLLIRERS